MPPHHPRRPLRSTAAGSGTEGLLLDVDQDAQHVLVHLQALKQRRPAVESKGRSSRPDPTSPWAQACHFPALSLHEAAQREITGVRGVCVEMLCEVWALSCTVLVCAVTAPSG